MQIQCVAWALNNGVTDGVWEGTAPDERRVIRSLSRRTTIRKADGDDKSYHPASPGTTPVPPRPEARASAMPIDMHDERQAAVRRPWQASKSRPSWCMPYHGGYSAPTTLKS